MAKVIDFLLGSKEELAKVVWPNREQTIKMTIMVIAVTLVIGFFIGGIDFILTQLTTLLLK